MKNMEKELEERELKELELMNENENREFYVYVHIRLDNNTVFYVGKGKGDRAYNLDRSNFHNGVCKEYGCRVEIIKDMLTESQAFRLESKMIKYYVITLGYGIPIDGYRDFSNNYLTNFTWGGEGVSGLNPFGNKTEEEMEEIRKKMSEKAKGKHHSEEAKMNMSKAKKGIQFSEEHKQNLSKSHKGMLGKHHSKETKMKQSESRKGMQFSEEHKQNLSKSHGKKVKCITTGETFDCAKDAEKHYKCCNISKCCNGKQKTAGKLNGVRLQWKYEEDYDNESKAV